MCEVADFVVAELIAMNGLVLYFQSKRRFPRWTSVGPLRQFNKRGYGAELVLTVFKKGLTGPFLQFRIWFDLLNLRSPDGGRDLKRSYESANTR
jgi:hypothetical protein